jgi:hypothetical protein
LKHALAQMSFHDADLRLFTQAHASRLYRTSASIE